MSHRVPPFKTVEKTLMPFEFQITDIRNEIFDIEYDLRWCWCGGAAPPHATVLLALLAVTFCIKICLAVSGRSLKRKPRDPSARAVFAPRQKPSPTKHVQGPSRLLSSCQSSVIPSQPEISEELQGPYWQHAWAGGWLDKPLARPSRGMEAGL